MGLYQVNGIAITRLVHSCPTCGLYQANGRASLEPCALPLEKRLRGNTIKGQQDQEPLRGKSASERVSEREGFQRFSEVFRGFYWFLEAPSETLSEADFPLRDSRSCCP